MLFRVRPTRLKYSSPIIKKNLKQIFRKSKIIKQNRNKTKTESVLTALAECFLKENCKVHQIIFINVYFNIQLHFFCIFNFP